jgi:hypothetical protein
MNADILNRGTEDRLSLSLFLSPLIEVPFNAGLTVYLTLYKKEFVTRRR